MRARALSIGLAAVLVTCACSGSSESDSPDSGTEPERSVARVGTAAVSERLTVVTGEDPVATSVSASRTFFEDADVVVVAAEGDRAGTLLGASAAVALGVPLLLGADGDGVAEPVLAELDRLGTTTVLAIGDAAPAPGAGSGSASASPSRQDAKVIGVPAQPAALAAVLGQDLAEAEPVAEGADVAAVAALDPDEPAALRPEGGGAAEGDVPEDVLPDVEDV
ncbi:MAG TPA: cell wall-binding repeat-containing protein, partial [Blastococcus sp.]